MATATLEKPQLLEVPVNELRSYHPRVIASGVSFDEFVCAPQFQGRRVEWVAGEVIEKMSVSLTHTLLVMFLSALLKFLADVEGGRVTVVQYLMRLEDQQRGREPDIIYVAPENEYRLLDNYLDGPADLVVEVVSPGSEAVDRGDKFKEYERGGVREYWLIDPQRREALFYIRDEDGLFRAGTIQSGVFQSQVLPTVKLRVEWLWEQPPVPEILRGWNLI